MEMGGMQLWDKMVFIADCPILSWRKEELVDLLDQLDVGFDPRELAFSKTSVCTARMEAVCLSGVMPGPKGSLHRMTPGHAGQRLPSQPAQPGQPIGNVFYGTCSGTDRTVIDAGSFYPVNARTVAIRRARCARQLTPSRTAGDAHCWRSPLIALAGWRS